MASISPPSSNASSSYGAKGICQIVGYACLVGFALDMLIVALPPQLGSTEWRVGLVQQFSDRSIILLFGAALLIFGNLSKRSRLRLFSQSSMVMGIIFFLMCLLAIADGVNLQQQTINTISTQESQLQTQIQNVRGNPNAARGNVTSEDLKKASEQLTRQANSLKQNAKNTVIKTGASSISNLVIVGFGLIGLGRYGMKLSRTRS